MVISSPELSHEWELTALQTSEFPMWTGTLIYVFSGTARSYAVYLSLFKGGNK